LHDRQHLAEASAAVEIAQQTTEASSVRAGLVRAVAAASALYGKDAQLDAFLRAQRHFPADWLADPETPAELGKLGNLLAAIPAPLRLDGPGPFRQNPPALLSRNSPLPGRKGRT
jgi:hypothetical protein